MILHQALGERLDQVRHCRILRESLSFHGRAS
jgi:hypothetical protein